MIGNSKGPGTVYLVGAGPGHPGLITRLGYELLQHCDAVAYDALVPLELIVELPERVETYYVGKRAGKHSLPQEDINELLVSLARRGRDVVRLKGGDPSIFGRSGEEAAYLTEAGIPVVVVPGVTAASAAAAISGFSLTDRRAASWVLMGTGHGADCSSIPVPWDQIATISGGTIALYMGLGRLDQIQKQLLSGGLSPDTPCAVVQCASTGLQKVLESPLCTLSDECRTLGIKPPALIFIGEVVRHRRGRERTTAEPLAGRTVLVTSPSWQASRHCGLLREKGAEPIAYPTVTRMAVADNEGWARFEKAVESGGLCMYMGEIEVRHFIEQLYSHGLDLRSLGRFRIAALGRSTANVLLDRGIKADLILNTAERQAIADRISKLIPTESSPLVLVRGNLDDDFLEVLRREWAEVIPLTVCLDSKAEWEAHWKENLIQNPPDYIAFASIVEVEGLFELMGADMTHLCAKSYIASLDMQVSEVIRKRGLQVAVEAKDPSVEGLVYALVSHLQEQVAEPAGGRDIVDRPRTVPEEESHHLPKPLCP